MSSSASRYQTQPCNAPPACVQNAMMTKDKKPFTYTPGGIDLSEIRSPRMAKRIARNAQYEGVTGPPKPSPLAAQNNTNSAAPPPPPPPMLPTGMPVQVFPTGPVGPAAKTSVPQPPPPPPPKSQLAPPNPPKASSPQNFEPPPFGCRPEIKIPPNPMATLRRVAPPRPKDDFWVEEYRKEKSRSPSYVPQNGDASSTNFNTVEPMQPPPSETPQQVAPRAETPPRPTYTENTGLGNRPGAGQQFQTPQQYTPPQQYQDRQQQQARPQQQQQPQTPKPQLQQYAPVQRRSPSPIRNVVGQHQHLQQKRTDSPFQSDDLPNLQRPLSPIKLNQGHSQEVMNNVQHNNRSKQPEAEQLQQLQSPNAKHVGTGSLYIPPVPPENLAVNKQKQQERTNGHSPQVQQSSPRDLPEKLPWMAQKQNKETPEWVRENEPDGLNYPSAGPPAVKSPPIQQFQQTQQTPSPFTFQPKVQSNNTSDGKERVIPIQFESQSPKVRTPPSAATVQDSSYNSPGNYTPPGYITRNPNQFVDQGYNNYPQQWQNANRVETPPARQQPPQQEQPYNWRTQNRVTSPSTQQQQPQQQQPMRPVQNRVTSPPAQSQPVQPSWSSPQSQQSPPVSGVTRIIPIQIEGQESPFNPNSVRGPIMQSPAVIQNDPRTLQHQNSWGGATPNQSKSFKILQKITDTDAKDDDNADRMRRMQLNEQEQGRGKNQVPTSRQPTQRYVQPRPPYQYDDMQHPYIHPSEQQVPEMKMYAGSAIPSRSFKMLQAMTTPENAAETESSGVEYEQIYPHNCCSHPYPPYPYPFYPPPIDPNWHYYYPPPPPPYFYYYPEYDSQMIMNGKCWDYNKGKYYQCNNEQEPTEISYKDCDKDTPNIIVTTATTDEESREDSEDSIGKNYPKENSSVLNMLSKKLNEITSPDLNTVQTDDSLQQEQERKNSLNLKSFKTSLSDNSQSSEALSSDSECQEEEEEEEEEEEHAKSEGHIEGLKAIKSVTNIKVYETVDDVSKIGTESCESDSESSEEEEEQSSSSSKHTTADDIDEDNASHDEDDDVEDITEDGEVAIKEQLSVIYEESERDACSRNKSNSDHSNASTLNDSLTTIANDDDDDDVGDGDKKNDSDLIESSDSDECEDIETDTSIDEEYSDEDDDHDAGKKTTVLPVEESLGVCNDSTVMKADIDCRNYESESIEEVKDNRESEDSEPENSSDKDEEDNEDNANMVTVRLPLKLSFSRSSNDEEITTVVVGTSEIQGEQSNTYRKSESAEIKENNKHTESDGSVEEEEETSDEDEEDCNRNSNRNDEPDVSVTISLPSRSNSTSKSPILLHNSSLDSVTSRDYNDCDSEISVSLSLPIKRNKSQPCAVEKISEGLILCEEVNDAKDWKDFENTNGEIPTTTTEDVRETSPPFKPERYKELTTLQDISANFGVLLRNTVKNVDRSLRALSMSRMSDYEKSNDLITSVDTLLNKTTEIGSRYAQTESSNETRKHDNKISSRSRKTRSLSRDILKDVSTTRDTWESFKQIGASNFESQKNETEIFKDDNDSDGSLDSLDLFSCRSRRAQSLKATEEKETVVAEDSSEDEVVRIDKKLERLARSTRSLSRDIIKDTKQTSETYDKYDVVFRNNSKLVDRKIKAFSSGLIEGNHDDDENKPPWLMPSEPEFQEKYYDTVNDITLNNVKTENTELCPVKSLSKDIAQDKKLEKLARSTRSHSRDMIKDTKQTSETYDKYDVVFRNNSKLVDRKIKAFSSGLIEGNYDDDENKPPWLMPSEPEFQEKYYDTVNDITLNNVKTESTELSPVKSLSKDIAQDKKLEKLARSTRSHSRDMIKDTKQTSETYDKYDVVFRNNSKLVDRKIKAFSSGLIEGNYDDDENKPPWLMPSEPEFQEKYYDTTNDLTLNNVKTESTELSLVKSLSKDIAQDVAKLTESLNIFDNPTVNRHSEECDNGSTPINGSCEEQNLEEDIKVCVREKIAAFETAAIIASEPKPSTSKGIFTKEDLCKPSENAVLSRISSLQKSESEELEEDDSGVTSDMSKAVSETDTESECFPELRKMSRYQRASTHSRLFKLLQDEAVTEESSCSLDGAIQQETTKQENPKSLKSRKKIIHNVSITRRTNPEAIKDAETMSERRERLSLPLRMSTSIDADNLSSSNSPSSPTCSSHMISDNLVNELVQSLLLKKKSNYLSNLPMEKLQAAAKRVLEEEFDSLENTSLESTPALTPQEFKNDVSGSYSDYYDTWSTNDTARRTINDIIPSKAFKNLQEQALSGKKRLWAARCPRVLSSKTINRDLARVTESRESESPDTYRSTPSCSSSNGTLDKCSDLARDDSSPKLGKV